MLQEMPFGAAESSHCMVGGMAAGRYISHACSFQKLEEGVVCRSFLCVGKRRHRCLSWKVPLSSLFHTFPGLYWSCSEHHQYRAPVFCLLLLWPRYLLGYAALL